MSETLIDDHGAGKWSTIGAILVNHVHSLYKVILERVEEGFDWYSKHSEKKVGITISVAANGKDPDAEDSGGKLDFRMYDKTGKLAGEVHKTKKLRADEPAHHFDYHLSKDFANAQVPYMKLSTGTKGQSEEVMNDIYNLPDRPTAGKTDPICIAWVIATWPDGTGWAWDGGFGRQCQALPWHFGSHAMGMYQKDDGTWVPHAPTCSWLGIDRTLKKNQKQAVPRGVDAFSVYLPSFAPQKSGEGEFDHIDVHSSTYCEEPNFKVYAVDSADKLSNYVVDIPDIDNAQIAHKKRTSKATSSSLRERLYTPPEHNTHVIESDWDHHSAIDLCASDTSWGHSFVSNPEGLFCEMSSKVLYPLCEATPIFPAALAAATGGIGGLKNETRTAATSACFDLTSLALVGANVTGKWLSHVKWSANA